MCHSTCARSPGAFPRCAGYIRYVVVQSLNRRTEIPFVIGIVMVIILSLSTPVKERGPAWWALYRGAPARALKHTVFLSRYRWSRCSTTSRWAAVCEFCRSWRHAELSGSAPCVVRIGPVMCNSSLENSFPLKLSWVLLLHISVLHHTEYSKFDVIFFFLFPWEPVNILW